MSNNSIENVIYDTRLSSSAKLLYHEIATLCSEKNTCEVNEEALADLYKVSVRAVQTWIKQLRDCGYIKSEPSYEEVGGRYLTLLDQKKADEN